MLFCIKIYFTFARGARKVRIETLGQPKAVRAEVLQDTLQNLYSELLEYATHLTMNDEDDIYYNILDTAYESAQKRYIKC